MPEDQSVTPAESSPSDHLRDLSALYEISLALTSGFELDGLLQRITSITVSVLGIKACTIRMLDKETGQ